MVNNGEENFVLVLRRVIFSSERPVFDDISIVYEIVEWKGF